MLDLDAIEQRYDIAQMDIPALMAEVQRLRAELAKLKTPCDDAEVHIVQEEQ